VRFVRDLSICAARRRENDMSKDNKKSLVAAGGIGIVMAGWLGASAYAGSVAEREIRAFAAKPSSETGVRVRNLQHSSGLFSATGSFGMELVDQCSSGEGGRARRWRWSIPSPTWCCPPRPCA
jgi:hypothetical protein